MKKSFLLCACLVVMAFTLTACGEKNNPETTVFRIASRLFFLFPNIFHRLPLDYRKLIKNVITRLFKKSANKLPIKGTRR